MKKILLTAVIAISSVFGANAQSYFGTTTKTNSSYRIGSTNTSVRYQQGYTRKDGTYVQGHYKTSNNRTNHDNYSTSGNMNGYTGSYGSQARDYSSSAYNYGSGRTIHTGSRGGQYYVNDRGNKVYVPKRK